MQLYLAQPRGFCAGVVRAIEIVERALKIHQAPVYVYHEIVHNAHVVADLKEQGAVFVERLADVPAGAVVVFSAHGVSGAIVAQAEQRHLDVIDATCPLVTKVHLQGQRYSAQGYAVIIVGHIEHEEVRGTMGSIPGEVHVVSKPEEVAGLEVSDPGKVAYVTQTTLSLDDTRDVIAALKDRFADIIGPGLSDICYATQNRQNAVRDLAREVDLVLVVGAQNSSNSNRLRDVAQQAEVSAYLIQDASEIRDEWLTAVSRVGLTAGASAPEALVQGVVDRLRAAGAVAVHNINGVTESTVFRLPRKLLEAGMITASGTPSME